jgi:hypothetical protein
MSFPLFIILLPLIAIPIIIHLLSSRRLIKIDFPSLLFIVKNEVKLMKWFRLKRLLLLIARISLIVFLILAAANLKIPFSFFYPGEIVFIDGSPSMEKAIVENNSGFIVPMHLGVPEFSSCLEKNPVGILITDAQENAFVDIIREQKRFPGVKIKKVSFPEGNLAVIDAVSGPSFEGEDLGLSFTVLNEYNEKRKSKFTFKSDGVIIDEGDKILKQGENTLDFTLSLNTGLHSLSLELEDEKGFDFDDTYFISVNVKERQNICVVSEEYPERLLAALSPSYFNVRWEKEITEIREDLFISLNAREGELQKLFEIGSSGIIFLSQRENTYITNRIPEKISTVVKESFQESFFDLKALSSIPINYSSLMIEGKTLVYFENGDPLINKMGAYLILPFSPEENDISLYPIFIPFLYELIEYISEEPPCRNIISGETITLASSFRPEIISPKGKKHYPIELGNGNYIFKQTEERGIYKLVAGNRTIGLAAVNAHPSESKLESLSDSELQHIFGESKLSNGASFFLMLTLLFFALTVFIEKAS